MRYVVLLGLAVLLAACSNPTPAATRPAPARGATSPAAASPAAGPFRVSARHCTPTRFTAVLENLGTVAEPVGLDVEFTRGREVVGMGEAPITAPVPPGDHVTAVSVNPSSRPSNGCTLLDYVVAAPDGSYPTYAP